MFANIVFEAVGLGKSLLTPSEYTDGVTGGFGAGGAAIVPLDFEPGSITVVPLPAAVWLLLPAVGFLVGFRRQGSAA